MKKNIVMIILLIGLIKNNYSQTLTTNFFVNSPATCTTCCDGAFTITPAGCTPGTYSITASDGSIPNVTINGFEYTNLCYGTYVFTLTSNSCTTGTISYSVGYGTTTNINNNLSQKDEVSVYPNPTNSILNIETKQEQFKTFTIEIKNSFGQSVFSSPFTTQIDLSCLPAGMYFLTLQSNYNKTTIKIIKK